MEAYNYSQSQLKIQVKGLSALSIYVDGHTWRATLDTPLSQLRMTVLCHRCRPVLHSPQPLTYSIPYLLSKWVILSSHCLSITHHIRSTPVNSSRLSRPSSEDGRCYGQRCAAYVPPLTRFVPSTPIWQTPSPQSVGSSRRLPWPSHQAAMLMAETVTSRGWIHLVISWSGNGSFWMIVRSSFPRYKPCQDSTPS